jgi:UDP-2,4-diacetamido-2,4,6-trideoxy-beta-L-altropyranose hydrolase
MHLLLRADSDASIGAGHVMRSLALARRWIAGGGTVTLLGRIDSERLRQRVADAGVILLPLEAPFEGANDLKQTIATLEKLGAGEPAWAVVDGYGFDARYHSAIRNHGFPLLVIDDLADRPCYHADIVLNQNLGAERLAYRGDADTRWLLGVRYALLQPEFDRWSDREPETRALARRVLVTVGGADPHRATDLILQALNGVAIDGLDITVVAGPVARGSAEDIAVASRHACRVVDNVCDMASLMASMDLAVTGGGSTCWEVACVGLPAIVLELSDNQKPSARALAAAGAVEDAGVVQAQKPMALAARIEALCVDAGRRRAMTEAGRRLVDGKGSARVVGRLGLGLPPLTLRRATGADSRALWELATDPSVRQQSFDPSPISWEMHVAWFERISVSPTVRMWVLAGDSGLAGQVRYEALDEAAEIGISVTPALRGFGLAARLLASTWASACRELGVPLARGVVFAANSSSVSAFREAGFTNSGGLQTIRGHECYVFTKTLES